VRLVFLDIGMRGMDGYETCRRIRRALGNGVLLVALTGFGQGEDNEKAARAGFDAHLTKPADRTALAAIITKRAATRM
jgi:CheY-like chemotaxis protein